MDEPLYPAAQGQQRQAEEQRYGHAERPSRPASWPDSGPFAKAFSDLTRPPLGTPKSWHALMFS